MKTDQQINRSTDSATRGLWAVWLLVGLLASPGCLEAPQAAGDAATATTVSDESTHPARTSTPTINVGIVLADRAGYFCMPLEQIGLPPDAKIVSLDSSCDCAQPRLVEYAIDGQTVQQGILLEFVAEGPPSGTADETMKDGAQPVDLGVILSVGLADGENRDFTLNLLQTVLVTSKEFSPDADNRTLDSQVSSYARE